MRIWPTLPKKQYSLSISDKNDIKHDKKINSGTINFALGLLGSQFPKILNGFRNYDYGVIRVTTSGLLHFKKNSPAP